MKRILALVLALTSCATPTPALWSTPPPLDPIRIVPRCGSVVPLNCASADDVARNLNDFVDASARAARERSRGSCALYPPGASWPMPEPPMHFAADPRTNSVLFTATPEDLPPILELVSRLDAHAERGTKYDQK
jgi:hypothetical protein